jgi:hypothetical protein
VQVRRRTNTQKGRGAEEHIGRKIDEQIDRGADGQLTEEQMNQ